MRQNIQGLDVEVVQFNTMPDLPITGLTEHEQRYLRWVNKIVGEHSTNTLMPTSNSPYATALGQAIETGIITEPGKYAIHIDHVTKKWQVFAVIE